MLKLGVSKTLPAKEWKDELRDFHRRIPIQQILFNPVNPV
jgi:hypothetical protein